MSVSSVGIATFGSAAIATPPVNDANNVKRDDNSDQPPPPPSNSAAKPSGGHTVDTTA